VPRHLLVKSIVSALVLAFSFSGCGGDDGKTGTERAKRKQTTAAPDADRCKPAREPRQRRVRKRRPPKLKLSEDKAYTARVVTSCGTFEIELDPKQAPRTGGSFVSLAREGFYDRLSFHRIVTGFVIQGGDPRGDGSGGPGYSIREAPPDDVVYSEGVVAMAKTEVERPGTSGSQFFVVTSDDAALEPVYALLGRVTKGLDVVHSIELVPAGPDERPVQPVAIRKIEIRTD
jgi:peptidyl-prolyl cis-trans isomerase B (cyclophilin B)